MQRILIMIGLTLLVLFPTICKGQTDTVYYDEDWHIGTFDNATYYRIISPDITYGYKIEDHFMKNDKLQMTGYLTGKIDDSTKNGAFVYYDDKGNKIKEGSYINNQETGEWKCYYDGSNALWHTDNYKNGNLYGELTSYYKDGKLKRKESHNGGGATVSGKCYNENGADIAFTPFRTMPKPNFDYQKYLIETMRYPSVAEENNIQGRVIVKFVIDTDGKIINPKIIKHVSTEIDAEAIRVISKMPQWEAGIVDDMPVKVFFTLPLTFKLQ